MKCFVLSVFFICMLSAQSFCMYPPPAIPNFNNIADAIGRELERRMPPANFTDELLEIAKLSVPVGIPCICCGFLSCFGCGVVTCACIGLYKCGCPNCSDIENTDEKSG